MSNATIGLLGAIAFLALFAAVFVLMDRLKKKELEMREQHTDTMRSLQSLWSDYQDLSSYAAKTRNELQMLLEHLGVEVAFSPPLVVRPRREKP